MTIKPIIAATLLAVSTLMAASGAASAGGGNYIGSHGHYSGHTHVDLGPADASEDYAFHDCKWLKQRALNTERASHWRAYRKCARQYGH